MRTHWFISLCLALIYLLGFSSTSRGIAKRIDRPPCPTLSMMCPTYPVSGSSPLLLSLEVGGARRKGLKDNEVVLVFKGVESKSKVSFKWEVLGGTIVTGQGTRTVSLEPVHASKPQPIELTARVLVGGVDPACEHARSCSLKINTDCPTPEKISEYGDLSFEAEKNHLDRLATYLLPTGPKSVAYIMGYGGRNSCYWREGELRAERAKNYLIEKYSIDKDRIVAFDGGYRKNLTVELFLSFNGGCGPFPTPTVRSSEAEIEMPCSQKYKSRNEPY